MNDPASAATPDPNQHAHDLLATQKLLRATLEASRDMIQVFQAVRNEQGEIVDFTWILNNHASEKFYGDVVGKRLLELQPGVVEEGIFDAFKQVVETGEPQQYEKHYVHEQFDGWFHQSVVKLNDGVATTTADITTRKGAQQQLQQSQALLQSVIDSSLDVIQVFKAVRDETGAILDFVWVVNNQKAIAQNGEVIGKSLLQLNPGVVPTGIFDRMVQVAQTGVASEQELYYPHEQFDGWFYQALVKTDEGVAMTTRDISPQKQAEQEILRLNEAAAQKMEDKYHAIFNAIDEGFCIQELLYDDRGKLVDLRTTEANPACERQTGFTKEVIGRWHSEFGLTTDRVWFDSYDRVAKTGESETVEHWHELSGRWYQASLSRIGEAGSRQLAVVFNDITERKRREQQQAFLLTLSDAISPLTDPVAIEGEVTQLLRAHFEAGWCYYVAWDEPAKRGVVQRDAARAGLASLVGDHDVSNEPEFLALLKANSLLAVSDYEHYEQLTPALRQRYTSLGFGSMLVATLVKQERLVASLLIGDTTIRSWSTPEQALLMQVAERTWAALEGAKAEAALRASQQRFVSIANLVPDLLWDSEPDGATNWYNDRWLAYTGQIFEEAIGWGWVEAIHPDDRAGSAQRYDAAVTAGKPLHQEHRIRRYDGEYRWFVVNALPLTDERSRVVKMYGAATDIHESKLAVEALRQADERFRTFANTAPVLLWETDADGLSFTNQHYLDFFGQEFNDLRQMGWARFLHPDDAAGYLATYQQAFVEGKPYVYECRLLRADGHYRWLYTTARPLNTHHFVGACIDITANKEAEEALRQADRRKDEFLAMLAHELRNPMATIRSGLTLLDLTLSQEMGLAASAASTVAMMSRQTDHLVRMVNDLLDVSRISRGKIELRKGRVDLVELVRQAQQSVQAQFNQQAKVLHLSLPSTPIELDGDATRLTQVVVNLLTNGLRYTGQQGQVWVSLLHQGQEAILQVRDNGIGLAADQLGAIFELFVQVDNSLARSKGGLGLGLTLVKRLADLHGGRVEAQSDGLGQGSTFTVYLPTLTRAPRPAPKPAPQAPVSASPERILVIDDNADAALMLTMLLKLKGYEAHSRTSGQAGLEAAERLRPAAILLDIGMPGMDGYDTCQLLRQQAWGSALVVIALTGYGQEEDRQRTREAGFNEHLVKPVDLEALTKMLTDLLDKDQNNVG